MKNPPTLSRAAGWPAALLLSCLSSSPLALAGGSHPPEKEATPAAAAPGLPPGVVELSAAARDNLGIRFAKAESRPVARTLRLPGAFEIAPGTRRVVSSRIAGQVTLKVKPQDTVAAGQVVAELVSPAWQEWRARLIEGKAQVALTEATEAEAKAKLTALEKHQEELKAIGGSHAEFHLEAEMVRASLPTKAAETALAKAKLSALEEQMAPLGGPTALQPVVRAAAAGTVETLLIEDGAWAEPSAPLLALQGTPRFVASAAQTQVPQMKAGLDARIAPPQGVEGPAFAGKLRLALAQDAQTRALPVFVEAEAPIQVPAWARAGQAGWLEIELPGSSPKALAIPDSALVKDGTELVFFRRDPRNPERVKRVVADIGATDGAWVEIKSGLAEGDEVIAKGAYAVALSTSATSNKAPAGYHFHGDGSLHKDDAKEGR